MSTKEIYQNNKEFKEYMDRYLRKNNITLEEALQHKIIQDIAEYYNKRSKGVV